MFRNQSVSQHQFAMVPRADIPRARFRMQKGLKTTFDAGWLIPVFCEEILPGDTFRVKMTGFARLATPIFPIMDNIHLESFFFFVPNRLVWDNWKRFMGEQYSPGESTSFLVPQVTSPAGGYAVNSIYDYFGLPTVGQVTVGQVISNISLPLRGYNLIYNEWFRDENLMVPAQRIVNDGPDNYTSYGLGRRGKRHDYFTSALPWPQKGASVSLPLGTQAPIVSTGVPVRITTSTSTGPFTGATIGVGSGAVGQNLTVGTSNIPAVVGQMTFANDVGGNGMGSLYADLSAATAATINQLRQSFQIQKLLERDARGGTRYTEIVRSHFGVISPDARLQRPEYLGGGSAPITINPIAQTSSLPGQTTPLGNLGGIGTMVAHRHGFSQSFTEHGFVIGLVSVRADLTYQQGMRRMWSRQTRYDYYFPAFAALGEQAILSKEIYCDGSVGDSSVFGYQERWAEYRYSPSQVTGYFRSTTAGTLDAWHLAQRFTSRPVLNQAFIEENPPMQRILAVGSAANGAHFIFDSVFDMDVVRPMPMYSVPGLIDHF